MATIEPPPFLKPRVVSKWNFKGSGVHRRLRVAVYERDNYSCVACGKSGLREDGMVQMWGGLVPVSDYDGRTSVWFTDGGELQLDHCVPLSDGGSSDIDNLQTMCQSCNCKKGTRTWKGF